MNPILIVLLIVVALVIVWGQIFLWIHRTKRQVAEEVTQSLGGYNIELTDDFASFFGLESRGLKQVRGNGCLALTKDEIYFLRWAPRMELRIPREKVLRVETVRSHLGKSKLVPLLKVHFTNEDGGADSVAWYVRDVPAWLAKLEGQ